jgi:D-alanine-D-alanine ligase-like ATP-grasp enzyme
VVLPVMALFGLHNRGVSVRREAVYVNVAQGIAVSLMSPYVLPYVSYFDLRCLVLPGRVGSSEDNEARFVFDG